MNNRDRERLIRKSIIKAVKDGRSVRVAAGCQGDLCALDCLTGHRGDWTQDPIMKMLQVKRNWIDSFIHGVDGNPRGYGGTNLDEPAFRLGRKIRAEFADADQI